MGINIKQKNPSFGKGFLIVYLGVDYAGKFTHFQASVKTASFVLGKFYLAGCAGVQGVILAFFDIFSWVDSGTSLSDNDHAGFNGLTIMNFDTKALRV